jgi:hypothetical protein
VQAAEALKLAAGIGTPLAGRLLMLDALAMGSASSASRRWSVGVPSPRTGPVRWRSPPVWAHRCVSRSPE